MKKIITSFAVSLIVLLLASCSSPQPSTALNVTLTEFVFTPDHFTVPAGQEITLNLTNNGADEHQFVIMKLGATVGADFGDDDLPNVYWRIQLKPGESQTTSFTAPTDPGDYQVVCGNQGHYIAGMVAKLTVVAP